MSALTDIREFAELCAHVDDPFADVPAVLRRAGLDDAAWHFLREQWLGKLRSDTTEARALIDRFIEAYAQERAGHDAATTAGAVTSVEVGPEPSRPSSAAAETMPDRDDVGPVAEGAPRAESRVVDVPSFLRGGPGAPAAPPAVPALEPSPAQPAPTPLGNETTEINLAQLLGSRLPFDPSKPSAASVPLVAPKSKGPMSGETTDIDVAALARAALAFRAAPGAASDAPKTAELPAPQAPAGNEAQPPGRRLVRFDPKTGTPLAAPYWEEVPPPGGNKR